MFDITKIFCFPLSVIEKAEVVDHFKKLHAEMKHLPCAIIKIKAINKRKRRQRIAKHDQARKG